MKSFFFVTALAFASLSVVASVHAQGLPMPGAGPSTPQKAPPVKKFNGQCYPPESIYYARITEGFVPFVGMIDCVKSGGVPVKR